MAHTLRTLYGFSVEITRLPRESYYRPNVLKRFLNNLDTPGTLLIVLDSETKVGSRRLSTTTPGHLDPGPHSFMDFLDEALREILNANALLLLHVESQMHTFADARLRSYRPGEELRCYKAIVSCSSTEPSTPWTQTSPAFLLECLVVSLKSYSDEANEFTTEELLNALKEQMSSQYQCQIYNRTPWSAGELSFIPVSCGKGEEGSAPAVAYPIVHHSGLAVTKAASLRRKD